MDTKIKSILPTHRDLYYGGAWHAPQGGYVDTFSPGTGDNLGPCAEANASDVDAAVQLAHAAFGEWRKTKPSVRSVALREMASILRKNSEELALIDAANCGNPVKEMMGDANAAAQMLDLAAGLAAEVKGETIPMGDGVVNYSVREPFGVCGRIVAYNHPLMFTAGRAGAALATGNTVIMKPPYQAPLSGYRYMELIDGILPPGVLNLLTCETPGSQALVEHPLVPRLSLIGSVPTGRTISRAAADKLKHVTLELGGKNACVIYPDADIERAANAAVDGMNFTWCGQSCGSVSRLFIHSSVYDRVMKIVLERVKHYQPGDPTDMATTMGAIVSKAQMDKVLGYIAIAKEEGATLAHGGARPPQPELACGNFVLPTVFTGVRQDMRIASEEVFGPVLSVLRWDDEERMFADVNAVEYGLTASVWTTSLATAHRAAARIEAGYIWVNKVSTHFIGASFGGFKQSGIGREESFEELMSFTQNKNVHVAF
ncbi:MAG: aldehyde dehydrogenase family protein [Ramlibacter sp.]|nr:aldehyde dehydrogenase family protein [Ramlibacter sp.]